MGLNSFPGVSVGAPAAGVAGGIHHGFWQNAGHIHAIFIHGAKDVLRVGALLQLPGLQGAHILLGRPLDRGPHDAVNGVPPHLDTGEMVHRFHVSDNMAFGVDLEKSVFPYIVIHSSLLLSLDLGQVCTLFHKALCLLVHQAIFLPKFGIILFKACCGVHSATGLLTLEQVHVALLAAAAFYNILGSASFHLCRPIGIGNGLASQRDDVGFAAGDGFCCHLRSDEVRGDDGKPGAH